MTSDNTKDILNEETMMERGRFTANGYTFAVEPVYLGEESAYIADMRISPVPNYTNNNNETKPIDELTDKELGTWAIAIFGDNVNAVGADKIQREGVFSRFLGFFIKRKDYHYYNATPAVQPFIKWIERKVSYNGKHIRFYDLERKFGLNKAEIEKLFIYFHEMSGF